MIKELMEISEKWWNTPEGATRKSSEGQVEDGVPKLVGTVARAQGCLLAVLFWKNSNCPTQLGREGLEE